MSIFQKQYNANSQEMAYPIETCLTNILKNIIWHLFAGESHQVVKITVTQCLQSPGTKSVGARSAGAGLVAPAGAESAGTEATAQDHQVLIVTGH